MGSGLRCWVVTVLGLSSDGFGVVSAGDVGGVEEAVSEGVSESGVSEVVEEDEDSVLEVSGVVVSVVSAGLSTDCDVVDTAEATSGSGNVSSPSSWTTFSAALR